jgi:glycosyltransferase involved in cell wall biosynthesis
MRRVNILFVIGEMGMGGSERLVHSLALRLDRTRFNPSVAWLYGDEALKEFQDLQVPLHYVPKIKRVDFSAMRKLARIIESESIDVVNAQHFMPAIYAYYGCKLASKKALVFTAHSRWELEAIAWKWRVAGGYLLRRIDASVGVSSDVCSAIQSVFKTNGSQTVTIENGVDTDLFGQEKDVHDLRGSLGLTDRDVVIGIVGNLKNVKNHRLLLQAFAKVIEELDNVKLLIVGRGSMGESDDTEDDLRVFVKNRGLADRVSFLGYRTNISELLQVMDVFCLTSLREGLPISLMEAMAAGLPVVGTNVEGIRDVIMPNVDGILVELGDVTALQNALIGLARDQEWRHRLGRMGREKAVKKYSLQRCIAEYEHLFLSTLSLPEKWSQEIGQPDK